MLLCTYIHIQIKGAVCHIVLLQVLNNDIMLIYIVTKYYRDKLVMRQ